MTLTAGTSASHARLRAIPTGLAAIAPLIDIDQISFQLVERTGVRYGAIPRTGDHAEGRRAMLLAEIDRQLRQARINPLPGWEWLALLPAQATQHVLKTYLIAPACRASAIPLDP